MRPWDETLPDAPFPIPPWLFGVDVDSVWARFGIVFVYMYGSVWVGVGIVVVSIWGGLEIELGSVWG